MVAMCAAIAPAAAAFKRSRMAGRDGRLALGTGEIWEATAKAVLTSRRSPQARTRLRPPRPRGRRRYQRVMSAPAEERAGEPGLTGSELREAWPVLSTDERLEGLALLTHAETEDLFLAMHAHDQAEMLVAAPPATRRSLIRFLPPDDAADVLQEAPPEEREGLLAFLDEPTRKEVVVLLAYEEDEAGGLMSP